MEHKSLRKHQEDFEIIYEAYLMFGDLVMRKALRYTSHEESMKEVLAQHLTEEAAHHKQEPEASDETKYFRMEKQIGANMIKKRLKAKKQPM
jgi:hypothetical protein